MTDSVCGRPSTVKLVVTSYHGSSIDRRIAMAASAARRWSGCSARQARPTRAGKVMKRRFYAPRSGAPSGDRDVLRAFAAVALVHLGALLELLDPPIDERPQQEQDLPDDLRELGLQLGGDELAQRLAGEARQAARETAAGRVPPQGWAAWSRGAAQPWGGPAGAARPPGWR